uniref:SSD domain-containing protein n=1 Tax=Globodera pallida TaxID=36090 RepID=A0A183CJZ1_GLOPA
MGSLLQLMVDDIPDQVSWTNLDPEHVVSQVIGNFDLGTIKNFFMRSGIGRGYQERVCIDPLDPSCPRTSPNYYGTVCDAIRHFDAQIVGKMLNGTIDDILTPFKAIADEDQEKKSGQNGKETSALDILHAFFGGSGKKSKTNGTAAVTHCDKYKFAFMRWLSHNWEQYSVLFRPDLLPKFPDYGQVMRHGCRGVASNVMKWPARMILGGLHHNASDGGIQAEALQSVILVASPTEVFRRFKDSPKFAGNGTKADLWSPLVAKEVISTWARAFTNSLYNHEFNRAGQLYIEQEKRVVHPLASTSISDMLAEFCDFNYAIILAGYLLMLLYALYSQCRFDGCCSLGVESAVGLALAGVFTVTMASIAGLGLATWLGINFNAATTQIVPFLALGIGVDNMFLLLHNYPQVVGNVARKELGFLMRETGMSVLTTSLNNIFAFWAGTILPIPALRSFCGQTAILLTTNLFGIFFIYPAFIALDLKRRKAGRRDLAFLCYYCLCMDDDEDTGDNRNSIRSKLANKALPNEQKLMMVKAETPRFSIPMEVEENGTETGQYFRRSLNPVVIGRVSTVGKCAQNGHTAHENQKKRRRSKLHKIYTLHGFLHIVYIPLLKRRAVKIAILVTMVALFTLHGFLHIVYIPLLKRRAVKIAILVTMVALFVLGIYGLSRSTIGLELSDVLPENTAPAAFLKTRDKFFSFYPMAVVICGEHVDFPTQQHQIDLLRRDIGLSRFVVKLPDGEPSERYWLQLFRDWLRGMQDRLDAAKRDGLLEDFDGPPPTKANGSSTLKTTMKRSPDLKIAYSLACSYGQNYDCARAGKVRLIDESGTINTEGFYNYLYGWHEYEQMFYAVSQASFYPRLRKLRQGPPGPMKYRYFIPPAPKPLFSRIPFYCDGLRDTPTIMQMIREIRAISENYTKLGLPNYPEGVAFTFWEQYLHLEYYLALAVGIISISVFCVITAIIFNPWAAAVVTCVVASMTVELAGFMGLAGVKLNPISAVTLITAVGIGVEFTAHVALAFLTSLGTREERMVQCLQHMFVPVIHGGMSTLLGIIMLAFSDFDFVVQYFFVVLTALVIIGLFNGLAVLPVLLAYVGPPCEIKPVNGRNRLAFPSAARVLQERSRKGTPPHSGNNNNVDDSMQSDLRINNSKKRLFKFITKLGLFIETTSTTSRRTTTVEMVTLVGPPLRPLVWPMPKSFRRLCSVFKNASTSHHSSFASDSSSLNDVKRKYSAEIDQLSASIKTFCLSSLKRNRKFHDRIRPVVADLERAVCASDGRSRLVPIGSIPSGMAFDASADINLAFFYAGDTQQQRELFMKDFCATTPDFMREFMEAIGDALKNFYDANPSDYRMVRRPSVVLNWRIPVVFGEFNNKLPRTAHNSFLCFFPNFKYHSKALNEQKSIVEVEIEMLVLRQLAHIVYWSFLFVLVHLCEFIAKIRIFSASIFCGQTLAGSSPYKTQPKSLQHFAFHLDDKRYLNYEFVCSLVRHCAEAGIGRVTLSDSWSQLKHKMAKNVDKIFGDELAGTTHRQKPQIVWLDSDEGRTEIVRACKKLSMSEAQVTAESVLGLLDHPEEPDFLVRVGPPFWQGPTLAAHTPMAIRTTEFHSVDGFASDRLLSDREFVSLLDEFSQRSRRFGA